MPSPSQATCHPPALLWSGGVEGLPGARTPRGARQGSKGTSESLTGTGDKKARGHE